MQDKSALVALSESFQMNPNMQVWAVLYIIAGLLLWAYLNDRKKKNKRIYNLMTPEQRKKRRNKYIIWGIVIFIIVIVIF